MSFLTYSRTTTRLASLSLRQFHPQVPQTRFASTKLDAPTISKITEAEQKLTGQAEPVADGPTAQAQKHAGEKLSASNISDITAGEKNITGKDGPVRGGPTSAAQSILTNHGNTGNTGSGRQAQTGGNQSQAGSGRSQSSGVLDSETISKITDAEKKITGNDEPARGGPTAEAQKHANSPITSGVLSDITAGEKKIAGDRVKDGPTSVAQSELGKSRNRSSE